MARVGFGGKKLCTMKLFKDPTLIGSSIPYHLQVLHWIAYIQSTDDGREEARSQ